MQSASRGIGPTSRCKPALSFFAGFTCFAHEYLHYTDMCTPIDPHYFINTLRYFEGKCVCVCFTVVDIWMNKQKHKFLWSTIDPRQFIQVKSQSNCTYQYNRCYSLFANFQTICVCIHACMYGFFHNQLYLHYFEHSIVFGRLTILTKYKRYICVFFTMVAIWNFKQKFKFLISTIDPR
jgi:hypothetical protein